MAFDYKYIVDGEYNWDAYGGDVVYSIDYIHKDWGYLVQKYSPEGVTEHGLLFSSSFEVFKKGEEYPGNFSKYSRECKDRLWAAIFGLKKDFFDNYNPDVVEHFVKNTAPVDKRYELYKRNLNLPEYSISRRVQTIVYSRLHEDDELMEPEGMIPTAKYN